MDDVEMGAAPEEGATRRDLTAYHGLPEALAEHGLKHLNVRTINQVFGTSRSLRDSIRPTSRRLYQRCAKMGDDNVERWYDKDGQLHRDDDLPAVIGPDGSKSWYKHGKRHRIDDLPAMIMADGAQRWYEHGVPMRTGGGPAEIWRNGAQVWLDENGEWHRDDDKPAMIWPDGTLFWFQHGKRHRDHNRPSIVEPNGISGLWSVNRG